MWCKKVQPIGQTWRPHTYILTIKKTLPLEFHKLDAAPFKAETLQVISPSFLLCRASFSGHLKQTGNTPSGYRTLAIPAVDNFEILWRNQHVTGLDIMVFPGNGELHAYTDPRFDVFTLSFRADLFEAALGTALDEVIHLPRSNMQRIRRLLNGYTMDEDLPALVLQHLHSTLSNARVAGNKNEHSSRIKVVQLTERFIDRYRDDPPTVEELCAETKVSKRTLEYAFAEHLGVTPKRFINSTRLNGVRKLLQSSTMSISDAANAWGFWHMGQFAKDYHKLFGELPSQTKEKSS